MTDTNKTASYEELHHLTTAGQQQQCWGPATRAKNALVALGEEDYANSTGVHWDYYAEGVKHLGAALLGDGGPLEEWFKGLTSVLRALKAQADGDLPLRSDDGLGLERVWTWPLRSPPPSIGKRAKVALYAKAFKARGLSLVCDEASGRPEVLKSGDGAVVIFTGPFPKTVALLDRALELLDGGLEAWKPKDGVHLLQLALHGDGWTCEGVNTWASPGADEPLSVRCRKGKPTIRSPFGDSQVSADAFKEQLADTRRGLRNTADVLDDLARAMGDGYKVTAGDVSARGPFLRVDNATGYPQVAVFQGAVTFCLLPGTPQIKYGPAANARLWSLVRLYRCAHD